MSKILVAITNYNFSENADYLKDIFKNEFNTIIIDSSSEKPPKQVDAIIENKYYPGLWNESVKLTIEKKYDWLFFIASDINFLFPEKDKIFNILKKITSEEKIGVYSPTVSLNSRCSFSNCFNQNTNNLRKVHLVEGFIFLARTKVLSIMHPIDYNINQYGWTLDIVMCELSRKLNLDVVVDDRICVFHPETKNKINTEIARKQGIAYRNFINESFRKS